MFRYENKFILFFDRLIEVIVYSMSTMKDHICQIALIQCIKNLFILISQYGEDEIPVRKFFNQLDNIVPISATVDAKNTTRLDGSNGNIMLRNSFQRSSSKHFRRLSGLYSQNLAFSILEITLAVVYDTNSELIKIIYSLETLELVIQLYPKLITLLGRSNFIEKIKNIFLRFRENEKIHNLSLNLFRVILFAKNAVFSRLLYTAVDYDNIEVIEVYSHFQSNQKQFDEVYDSRDDVILQKLKTSLQGFYTFNEKISEGDDEYDVECENSIQNLFIFACQKSSLGIVQAMLESKQAKVKLNEKFIRNLVLSSSISNDIKTILLMKLARDSVDGRLDWSGLNLENVTPQFLASLANDTTSVMIEISEMGKELINFIKHICPSGSDFGTIYFTQFKNHKNIRHIKGKYNSVVY